MCHLHPHTVIIRFSTISDAELDTQIRSVKEEMPDVGQRMTLGALRSKGIVVPRRRICEALHRVDPINIALMAA